MCTVPYFYSWSRSRIRLRDFKSLRRYDLDPDPTFNLIRIWTHLQAYFLYFSSFMTGGIHKQNSDLIFLFLLFHIFQTEGRDSQIYSATKHGRLTRQVCSAKIITTDGPWPLSDPTNWTMHPFFRIALQRFCRFFYT